MSATNDAGKLLLTPKGEYSGSTTYEVMDAVYYITSTVKGVYVAKGTTTGNLPTDTTKWKLLIDLGDFITDASLATSSMVGLVKPDGITDEVDALGVLTALGVVIKATIDGTATAYSATWLKVGNTTLTPNTKQMYRVTEGGVECLYYWNGTNYTKIPAGHTIVNSSGVSMNTRSKMKFVGANVTDDSTNDQTVITITGGGGGSSESVVDLVKDTVGFTGKNRAYSQTNNAVVAHITSGKSYTVSWTGSATITLKKDSASGTEITSGSTSPLTFTADADYSLYFGSSDDVTQIMVCDSALDGEYEDYHDSVETMFEEEIHGVNLFDLTPFTTQSVNGITYTKVNNEIINVTGQVTTGETFAHAIFDTSEEYPAGKYIYEDGLNNEHAGTVIRLDSSSGSVVINTLTSVNLHEFTLTEPHKLNVKFYRDKNETGNYTIKPMLYKAELGSNLPFHAPNPQSIQHQINDITGVTGVRNLLSNEATSQTISGVTFTVNNDPDSSNYKSVTVNGTATAEIYFPLLQTIRAFKSGKYILSGCSKGGSSSTYMLKIQQKPSNTYQYRDFGGGIEFTLSESDAHQVYIQIVNGTVCNNLVFKPMIALESDPLADYDHYVPYAMTNRELTEGLIVEKSFTPTITFEDATQAQIQVAFTAKQVGNVVCVDGYIQTKKDLPAISTINMSVSGLPASILGGSGSSYSSDDVMAFNYNSTGISLRLPKASTTGKSIRIAYMYATANI